jgi:hypothetical protein
MARNPVEIRLYTCVVYKCRALRLHYAAYWLKVNFSLRYITKPRLHDWGTRWLRGRDSSMGIATRYGLDGPRIEFWWGRDFPCPFRPALGTTQPRVQWVPIFPGVNRPGHGVDHSLASSTEVEGRVELYICFPSGPSWPVLG